MLKILITLSMISSLSISKVLISPLDAMINTYSQSALVKKKNVTLTKNKAKLVEKKAKTRFKNKKFKYFIAKVDRKIVGYGILVNRKVRSKNAVTMYFIDVNGVSKGIEVIAFNEPLEFLASKKWMSQFENISYEKKLKVNKDIPTITGATLTARSLVTGSRIASAFYEVILKDK